MRRWKAFFLSATIAAGITLAANMHPRPEMDIRGATDTEATGDGIEPTSPGDRSQAIADTTAESGSSSPVNPLRAASPVAGRSEKVVNPVKDGLSAMLERVELTMDGVESRVSEMLETGRPFELVVSRDESGFWREDVDGVQHFITVEVWADGVPTEWTAIDMDLKEPRTSGKWGVLVDQDTFSRLASEKAMHGAVRNPVIGYGDHDGVRWTVETDGSVVSGWGRE